MQTRFFRKMDTSRLYISGLPYSLTQDELYAWLAEKDAKPERLYVHWGDKNRVLCSAHLYYDSCALLQCCTLNGNWYGQYQVKCVVAEPKTFLGCILVGHLGWALGVGTLGGLGTWVGHLAWALVFFPSKDSC